MPRVVSYEEARAGQFRYKGDSVRTPFLNSSPEHQELPVAFLLQYDPNRVTLPHFHIEPQWQIIVEGKCTLGRHDVTAPSVHFTQPYTPYGPLVADSKTGVGVFVLFPRYQPGAQYLPQKRDRLKQAVGRQPWQVTRKVDFRPAVPGTVSLHELSGIRDDRGRFVTSLTMAPNTHTQAPDPAGGAGQYVVVVKGSLLHEGREHKAYTIVYSEPNEAPVELHAGAEGLDAIIVSFPRGTAATTAMPVSVDASRYRRWQCELCAFAYDEALGLPDDGIAPGTRWQDVPDHWTCPDCAASKSDFRMVEVPPGAAVSKS
jgi:rubredoxin